MEHLLADQRAYEYDLLWGPIPREIGVRQGALAGCESVLIRPRPSALLNDIMERVRSLVPPDHYPLATDTAERFAKRLAASEFLDIITVLKGGCGPARVALNATDYAQPRR